MVALVDATRSDIGRQVVAWRGIGRLAWLTLVVTTVVLLVAAVPARYQELLLTIQALAPSPAPEPAEPGRAAGLLAGLLLALELAVAAAFLGTALLIARRRPDDRVAMLVSAILVAYIAWISPALDTLAATASLWWLPAVLIQAVGMTGAATFFLIFPDGHFLPRWTRLGAVGLAGWGLGWVLMPTSPLNLADPFRLPLPSFALLMACWAVGLGAQLYRFARQARPLRQQTMVILFGVTIAVLGYLAFGLDRIVLPALQAGQPAGGVRDLVAVALFLTLLLVIPASFTLAILRYHLWDIDIIMRRTLVYGVLTAILGGIYIASITLSQRLFVAVTGERSDAAIVLTTLVVASSLTPVRTYLQMLADTYLKDQPPGDRPAVLAAGWRGGAPTCRVRGARASSQAELRRRGFDRRRQRSQVGAVRLGPPPGARRSVQRRVPAGTVPS